MTQSNTPPQVWDEATLDGGIAKNADAVIVAMQLRDDMLAKVNRILPPSSNFRGEVIKEVINLLKEQP